MRPQDGTFVETWSGRRVDLTRPTSDMIDIEDIATALARICRFNGHCRVAYTVAQHSLLVVSMLRDNELASRWALLHDAHEAYVGDVVRPVKRAMGIHFDGHGLDAIVRSLDDAIAEAFGVHRSPVIHHQVYFADQMALRLEADRLMPSRGEDWPSLPPLPAKVPALPLMAESEETIRQAYLLEFDRLFPGVRRG